MEENKHPKACETSKKELRTTSIANNPKWRKLIDAGKFEQEKAILSWKTTESDIASIKVKTAIDAINYEAPTLATIKKYQGEAKMKGVLIFLVAKANKAMNVKRGMSIEQIQEAVEDIYECYYYLNIAELKLAFRRGVRGDYADQPYERFDISVLLGWLRQYSQDRPHDSGREKPETNGKAISSEMSKMFAELAHQIKLRQLKKQKEKSTFKHYRSIEEYCTVKGIDFDSYCVKLYSKWKMEYAERGDEIYTSFGLFMHWKYNQHLLELNENKIE